MHRSGMLTGLLAPALAVASIACKGDGQSRERPVYGGLVGSEQGEPIFPGLAVPAPGPCEEAIRSVRRMIHAAGVHTGDPGVVRARDAVFGVCAETADSDGVLRCVRAAGGLAGLEACGNASSPPTSDCEAIRRHYVDIMLVDAVAADAAEGYTVAHIANFASPAPWLAKCMKSGIPKPAVECVLAARTLRAFTACGL